MALLPEPDVRAILSGRSSWTLSSSACFRDDRNLVDRRLVDREELTPGQLSASSTSGFSTGAIVYLRTEGNPEHYTT